VHFWIGRLVLGWQCSLLYGVQTLCGPSDFLYHVMANGCYFPGGKAGEAWSWPRSSEDVKQSAAVPRLPHGIVFIKLSRGTNLWKVSTRFAARGGRSVGTFRLRSNRHGAVTLSVPVINLIGTFHSLLHLSVPNIPPTSHFPRGTLLHRRIANYIAPPGFS
jgi:hypothetical protein